MKGVVSNDEAPERANLSEASNPVKGWIPTGTRKTNYTRNCASQVNPTSPAAEPRRYRRCCVADVQQSAAQHHNGFRPDRIALKKAPEVCHLKRDENDKASFAIAGLRFCVKPLSLSGVYDLDMENYSVYFITEEKELSTKIGFSSSIELRLSELQIGNPRELWVSATIDGLTLQSARSMESYLHRRFQAYRIRGEWFLPNVFYIDWFPEKFRMPRTARINLIDLPIIDRRR